MRPKDPRDSRRTATPQVKGRDKRVKKDILAAITFLLTGLMFFLAQLVAPPQNTGPSVEESRAAETVSAEAGSKQPLPHPLLRDS